MNVPGSNLLNEALALIGPQPILYFPYVTRTKLANGQWATTYSAGQPIQGSVQPVARTLYSIYGLDFQKNYYMFFIQRNVIDVARNVAGDQFEYQGKNFQSVSKTNWFGADGWDEILCAQVAKF